MNPKLLDKTAIAVVIPYYNAAAHIAAVVSKLPTYIDAVIITNDCSPQPLPEAAIRSALKPSTQLILLQNPINLGVGGATKTGLRYAMENGFDLVVKMDADDQMDPSYLPKLLKPLLKGKAEISKGNRFRDLEALKKMPIIRRMGNLMLSFLTKLATGYWNNFDFNNGYIAMKTASLKKINLNKLSDRYFFETSLIAQLYFIKARIIDIAMPAIYGDEKSSMNLWSMPLVFSSRLLKVFIKRIGKEYFLYDFNIGSIYILSGIPLFLFGLIFGVFEWLHYNSLGTAAPTGTIMLAVLPIIIGFQLILQAVQYDIIQAPKPSK